MAVGIVPASAAVRMGGMKSTAAIALVILGLALLTLSIFDNGYREIATAGAVLVAGGVLADSRKP